MLRILAWSCLCITAVAGDYTVNNRYVIAERSSCEPLEPMEIVITSADFHCPLCEVLKRDIKNGVFEGVHIRYAPAWPGMGGYPKIRFRDAEDGGKWKVYRTYNKTVQKDILRRLRQHRSNAVGQSNSSSDFAEVRQMSYGEKVHLHNQLHGGGSWSWPGDLDEHLRSVHGVKSFDIGELK